MVRSSPLAFCLFISLVLSSVFSSLPASPPPHRSGVRLFVACLHLFSEHQAQFFSHWAAYGATATHTTLILHPSPAFRQYFFPGFKRDCAVGFQTSRVTGRSPDYVSNIKSTRLNRSAVEPLLARMYQLWRVTVPLASFALASPSVLTRSGVFPRRGRPGKRRSIVHSSHHRRSTTLFIWWPLLFFFKGGRRFRFHHTGGPWDSAHQSQLLRRLSFDPHDQAGPG